MSTAADIAPGLDQVAEVLGERSGLVLTGAGMSTARIHLRAI